MPVLTAGRTTAGRRPSRASRALAGAAFTALLALASAVPAGAKLVLAKLGGEQQINVRPFGDQVHPAIASDAQGNYAVAWIGPSETFVTHLFVRLFHADGTPRSGEILVDGEAASFENLEAPRIAMAPDGRFAVVWTTDHVWVRLYDAAGTPSGGRLRADDIGRLSGTTGDAAMAPDGRLTVTWLVAPSTIYLRSFNAAGTPLEPGRAISAVQGGSLQAPRVVVTSEGKVVVVAVQIRIPNVFRRDDRILAFLRSGLLGTWTPEIQLNGELLHGFQTPVVAAGPSGTFSVIWTSATYKAPPDPVGSFELRAGRFDADGQPLTPEVKLALDPNFQGSPALATDPYGNSLVAVAYPGIETQPQARLFAPDWSPVGAPFPLSTYEGDIQLDPVLARGGAEGDGFVGAWSTGLYASPFPIPYNGEDGSGFGIFAQRFAAPLCAEGSKILCLGPDGRFELSVDWTTPNAQHGIGRAHPITGDTGAFWFFEPSNLELLTKVLDGTTTNNHYWYFSGALSDVYYTVKVRDTASGEEKSYHNPQGQLASRADTEAFSVAVPAGSSLAPGAPTSSAKLSPTIPCEDADPATLCLPLEPPFHVTVDFVDPRTGQHGTAQPLRLTANTGAFSFFDAANLELVVKVLDGRSINGAFWVFYGGLSDVEYAITVTNLSTGLAKTYTHPRGGLESRADTAAFP